MQIDLDKDILLALLRGERNVFVPQDAWQVAARLAVRHGVSELLYQRFTQLEGTVPVAHLHELRKNYLLSAARNSFFYHELANILAKFHNENIPVIVLKGAFLAERIYENIAARPMGDIDLLVSENNLLKVDALLLRLGFHRQFHNLERSNEEHALPYQNAQNGLVIEIHWVLMDAKYGMQADIEQLWKRTRPSTIGGNPVLELSAEDQILHLCIHTSVHVFEMGLKALCDLDATLRHYYEEINWDSLHQRAYQWKAERCIYINLRLAHELMHSPVTKEWLDRNKPEDFEEQYYLLAKEHLFRSVEEPGAAMPDAVGVVRFWTTDGWFNKLGVLLRRIFPPRDEMARMYPAPADSLRIYLFYPARFIDLLHRFGQLGFRLMLGEKRMIVRAQRQNQVNDLRDWMITRKQ